MLCIKHTFFKVLHIFLFRGGAPVGGHSLWSVQWRQEKKTLSRDPTQQAKNGGCEAALVVWQILFPGTLCGQCEVCAVGYVVWSGCYFSTGSQEGICHSIRSWSGEGVCGGGGERWKVGRLCVIFSSSSGPLTGTNSGIWYRGPIRPCPLLSCFQEEIIGEGWARTEQFSGVHH